MTPNGFVQNNELLEECSNTKDLLNFEKVSLQFSKKIDRIQSSAILALVGPFGSGKSTLLHNLACSRPSEKWFEFDAWEYPDRQNLWEGFVLDVLKAVAPEEFNKARKELAGTEKDLEKNCINMVSKLPGLSALEGLNYLFATSPARRVCEIQEVLANHLKKVKGNLIIIVEDIDRSGDSGIFFIETLKQFLRKYQFENRILVIVPMANENYEKNLGSYLKSIDYFEFFEVPEIKLEDFVNEVFDPDLFKDQKNRQVDNKLIWTGENRRLQTIDFLEALFKEMPNMSMRLLKLILRKANIAYKNQVEDGLDPDFRVSICIEASKYFKTSLDSKGTYFESFKNKRSIETGNIFSAFLLAMLTNKNEIYLTNYDSTGKPSRKLLHPQFSFKFFDRQDNNINSWPSTPYEYGNYAGDKGYGITSFYLNY